MSARSRQIYLPRFIRVQFAMIMREMATSYGQSVFGYLWAVLEPIGGIVMLSLAFSLAFAVPALGEVFPLFYATGYMPFVVYGTMQSKINGAIRENKKLLFYPRVTYIDAIISRFVLHLVTLLLVSIIVFSGIFLIYDIPLAIDIVLIAKGLLAAAVLGLGVGCLNSVIVHLAPSWKQIWGIITRPIFLVSTIFYLFDTLPAWAQSILWYNPLVHVIGIVRKGIYRNYDADFVQIEYPFIIGLVATLIGLVLLRRYASAMVNV